MTSEVGLTQPTELPSQKPLCAVRGLIRPGAMCGRVIVGAKLCGAEPGTCQHQRTNQPEKPNE